MLEYEFETVDCMEGGGGYSLFGGFGMESVRHRELICRRAADGWRYVGFVPKSLFKISTCMDWRVDFLPCKAKIRRHPDGWQGFLTQSGRKIRRQDMRGEILNRL